MSQPLLLTCLLMIACSAAPQVSVLDDAPGREAFLGRMDAALTSRDPMAILPLCDLATWRKSGRPEPVGSAMTLPAAPITRVRDTPAGEQPDTEALYQDGRGKRWRLRFQYRADRQAWLAVLHDEPCPRGGGMARGLEWERGSSPGARPQTWTPLECWPLPL